MFDMLETRTWEQLSVLAAAIEDRRIDDIDLVTVPLAAAQGAKFKGYGPARRKAKARQREKERLASLPPDVAAGAKEKALLDSLASAGIKVRSGG